MPARPTRVCHGAEDAAASVRNLLVRDARVALLELISALAREDEMRVRVHEAGEHGARSIRAAGIEAALFRHGLDIDRSHKRVFRADPDDAPLACGERAALDDA